MRYLWDLYPAYLHEWTRSPVKRALMATLTGYLRLWDQSSAAHVDEFIANSHNVQNRIWKAYRRDSDVIYPPVAVEDFWTGAPQDYYLIVSELVAYKRIADAVRYCSRTGRRLRIVGDGPQYRELRNLAGPSVQFCGRVPDIELRKLYAHSRALLVPGEEDFGIAAVEALASGKPIIGVGRGGVLESAPRINPRAGFFYREAGDEGLRTAIEEFEQEEQFLSPTAIRAHAMRFSEERFREEMSNVIFDRNLQRGQTHRSLAIVAQ